VKKILFLFLALFLRSTIMWAQTDLEMDSVIVGLVRNLPAGWTMKHVDTLFTITRNKPVYRVPANHINEPMYMHGQDSATTDNDKPPVGAKLVEMKFVIGLTPRWKRDRYLTAEKFNRNIEKRIEHLRGERKSGGTVYKTKGKKGQMIKIQGDTAVDRFNENLQDEILKLEKLKMDIPTYCSEYYFLKEYNTYYCTYPADDDPRYYSIFPSQAETELDQIQDYMHDHCNAYRAYHTEKNK
jgi:hypothetical protein